MKPPQPTSSGRVIVHKCVPLSQRGTRPSCTMYIGHIGFACGQVNDFAYASLCDVATASFHPLWQQPTLSTATHSLSSVHARYCAAAPASVAPGPDAVAVSTPAAPPAPPPSAIDVERRGGAADGCVAAADGCAGACGSALALPPAAGWPVVGAVTAVDCGCAHAAPAASASASANDEACMFPGVYNAKSPRCES